MRSEEQQQLRETAREFARRELEPNAAVWDAGREFPEAAFRGLAELGFLGLLVPEEEGGSGFDSLGFCIAVEELSRSVPAVGLLLSIHNGPVCHALRSGGGPAARERWLSRLATGETLGAFALSEASAGSDATALGTRYVRADGGFVLDGEKAWVSGAGRAGMAVVFARGADGDGGRP
nr:acyl-CoA dehydrogenase family protein [Gemmatimonadota bacterium]